MLRGDLATEQGTSSCRRRQQGRLLGGNLFFPSLLFIHIICLVTASFRCRMYSSSLCIRPRVDSWGPQQQSGPRHLNFPFPLTSLSQRRLWSHCLVSNPGQQGAWSLLHPFLSGSQLLQRAWAQSCSERDWGERGVFESFLMDTQPGAHQYSSHNVTWVEVGRETKWVCKCPDMAQSGSWMERVDPLGNKVRQENGDGEEAASASLIDPVNLTAISVLIAWICHV